MDTEKLAKQVLELFAGRPDVAAERWSNNNSGQEKSGFRPICENRSRAGQCPKKTDKKIKCHACENKDYQGATRELVRRHVQGEIVLGAYPLHPDDTCHWIAGDFDDHDGTRNPLEDIRQVSAQLALVGLPHYVLASKSGTGYHLYVFFRDPVPAWKARHVLLHFCHTAGVIGGEKASFDRLFPCQDKLSAPDSPGNLIAMPFQGGAMANGWTMILDPASGFTVPLSDQIATLEGIEKIAEADLDRILALKGVQTPPLVKRAPTTPKVGETPVEVFPPADLALIEQHCAFMAHCRDTAKSLGEPKWFAQACIFAHCENGAALFHERSQPHPGYSPGECTSKFEHARAYGPRTCESIESEIGFVGCSACIYKGHVRSPISLGDPSPAIQARFVLAQVLNDVPNDPGAPFCDHALAALAELQRNDRSQFMRLRDALKKAGASVKKLDEAINAKQRGKVVTGVPYRIEGARMIFERPAVGGIVDVLLANFAVTITEEITRDDGAEQVKAFRLEGQLASGTPLPSVVVDASTFPCSNWVTEKYGAGAVVMPGQREQFSAAVRLLSQNIAQRTIFSHVGWRQLGDGFVYLDVNGAIKESGRDISIQVDLGQAMQHYSLPMLAGAHQTESTTHVQNASASIKTSLRLLALAPLAVSYPVLAAIFRAPLSEACPVDFSLFFDGLTGTRKTEFAAIAQGHFGPDFHGKNLPGSWSSTENALEKAAFLAKDAILVIDDFNPVGTIADVGMWHRKADRVLRGQGNQAGRARMQANGAFRPTYFPRGLIVATGEALPRGPSLRARLLVLEFDQQTVNLAVLTELQGKAADGTLAKTMAAYVRWLAPQMEKLKATLPARKIALREEISEQLAVHSRTPDIIVSLMLGIEAFLEFALIHGAMSDDEAQQMREEALAAILEAGKAQGSLQESECPCRRFLELLACALASGACHLENRSGGAPALFPEACGWRLTPVAGGGEDMRPQAQQVGWLDSHGVYLLPDAAFAIVQRLGTTQGYSMPLGIRDFQKRLRDKGLLVSTDGSNNTTRINVGTTRPRVLHLAVESLFDVVRDPVKVPPLVSLASPSFVDGPTIIEDAPFDMDDFE